jgi:PAS domain S-box-containing protein
MSTTKTSCPVQHRPDAAWLPNELGAEDATPGMLLALFVGNPDMVIVTDAKGKIVAANPSAVAGFGYSREQLEGQSPSMLLPEAVRERHAGHVRDFQEHRSIRAMGSGMNLKARNAAGEEFPVDVMLYPFAAGNRQYTMAVCRRLDAALARSQMQIHAIVESVQDYAINLLDAQGRILTWNEGSRRIHGMTATEALGQNFSIFFTQEDIARGAPEELLREAARSGHHHTAGWRIGSLGTAIWAEIDFAAVRDTSGQLVGFTRVLHDMTAHKQADEALRQANRALVESEERFRLLVEPVKEYAIYMLDPEGRVMTWNEGAERNKGYKAAEVVGQNFSIFFLPEDVLAGLPALELAAAIRDGRFETEAWRLRKDGTKFWALVTLTSIHGQDGTLRGFAKVTRDMTAQKESREALRSLNDQLARYRIFVDNMLDYGIYTLDAEGRITSWEAGAQKQSGSAPQEVLGRHYSMFFSAADADAGLPQLCLDEAARTGRYLSDYWAITPNGERVWSSGVLNAVRDETGRLTGFIRVARNMTKQKLLEESLERLTADLEIRVSERTRDLEAAMEELHRKNEEVEAFVYIVSHDLRAPLVNVQGFVRELRDSSTRLTACLNSCSLPEENRATVHEILNDEIAGALHFISASATKFERLINALIGLSRHGRQAYQIVQVDVDEQVANTVATLRQGITEAGAEVEVGRLPPAYADATALGQVFSNLIGNALKYRSPHRSLKVAVGGHVEEGAVHYWVRDNGLGIPESGKARLFQVFQRLHPQAAPGEGMGLAIVHRIVGRHQGKVWAESQDGEGSTFHFSLPSDHSFTTNIDREITAHGDD